MVKLCRKRTPLRWKRRSNDWLNFQVSGLGASALMQRSIAFRVLGGSRNLQERLLEPPETD